MTDSLFTSEKLRITLSFSEVLLIMHWAGLQLLHREKDGQRAKGKKIKEFCELGLLHPFIFFFLLILLPSGILNVCNVHQIIPFLTAHLIVLFL